MSELALEYFLVDLVETPTPELLNRASAYEVQTMEADCLNVSFGISRNFLRKRCV